MEKKIGDMVAKDEVLAYIHANDLEKLQIAKEKLIKVIKVRKEKVEPIKNIIEVIK